MDVYEWLAPLARCNLPGIMNKDFDALTGSQYIFGGEDTSTLKPPSWMDF
jgi:hypothetical protein